MLMSNIGLSYEIIVCPPAASSQPSSIMGLSDCGLFFFVLLSSLSCKGDDNSIGPNLSNVCGDNGNTCSSITLRREGSLSSLVRLMNNISFENWQYPHGSVENYSSLMNAFAPWIQAPPPVDLDIEQSPFPINDVDCGAPIYSAALTGAKLPIPRLLVDFVPFGYDIEKLEIRLFESYDIVDVFVIYESHLTQSGLVKPLYLSPIINSSKFQAWRDKIIHIVAAPEELEEYRLQTMTGENHMALENSMRIEMIRKFSKLDRLKYPLKRKVMQQLSNAYALQNDGDEIVTRQALLHYKHCEVKHDEDRLYFPCMSFKKNFHWMQKTYDLTCMNGGNVNVHTAELKSFQWRPGPFAWPLASMLAAGSTGRLHEGKELQNFCQYHMGLGSAVHMSSVAEPVEYLMKRCGVIEQHHHGALPTKIVEAGKKRRVTAKLLASTLVTPWCSQQHPMRHVSSLRNAEARDLAIGSIPWVVLYNPRSFPFLVPAIPLEDMQRHLQRVVAQVANVSVPVPVPVSVVGKLRALLADVEYQLGSGGVVFESAGVGFAKAWGEPQWVQVCERLNGVSY